jgi:hypothetical protein
MSTMQLEHLAERLSALPGAVVGCGPKHPSQPDVSIAPRIEWLLENYPGLRRYQSYIDFLEMYAGACVESKRKDDLVSIFGFRDEFFNIDTEDGEIETDGRILFAMCIYFRDREDGKDRLDTYQYNFYWDTSGVRRPGIYEEDYYSFSSAATEPPSWYADDFRDWLAELIEKKGIYERPSRREPPGQS